MFTHTCSSDAPFSHDDLDCSSMWPLHSTPNPNMHYLDVNTPHDLTQESKDSFYFLLFFSFFFSLLNAFKFPTQKTGTFSRNHMGLMRSPSLHFLAGLQHLQDLHSHSQKAFHFCCSTAQAMEKKNYNLVVERKIKDKRQGGGSFCWNKMPYSYSLIRK